MVQRNASVLLDLNSPSLGDLSVLVCPQYVQYIQKSCDELNLMIWRLCIGGISNLLFFCILIVAIGEIPNQYLFTVM